MPAVRRGADAAQDGEAAPAQKVLAVLISDLHLSHHPPLARAGDDDWYAVQAKYLGQLRGIAAEAGDAPVVIAGDVFDRWNSPAELISLALRHLPARVYALPGQHDLPYHAYADVRKSAFWTLVEAGRVVPLEPGRPVCAGDVRLHGFPWKEPIVPLGERGGLCLEVAVCHAYACTERTAHGGAGAAAGMVKSYRDRLRGYDVAHFGDNHKSFLVHLDHGCTVFNPGTFFRRRSDERGHRPHAGLLLAGGGVERRHLDCSGDRVASADEVASTRVDAGTDLRGLLEELFRLREATANFPDIVRRVLDERGVRDEVRRLVAAALDEAGAA